MAAYDANPNLELGLQQPHDDEEPVVFAGEQATFDTGRGMHHMNVDAQAPRDIRDLQQAAVKVLEVHRFDRDDVAKISEAIKRALIGNLPSENASVYDSPAVNNFCQILRICLEQIIDRLGDDPDNPTIQHIKDLGITIEKIVVECIAVYMHFATKEDQANFFYHLLLGKLVNNLQKSILTQEYRHSFVTLDDKATTCSGEPLTKDQKEITKSFLEQIFDSLRITVWIKVADFLELGSNSDSKTSFKIKIGGPVMQSPTSATMGTIGMRPLEHTSEVCRLLLNSGRLGAEQMRLIESRLLHSTMLASTIGLPEGSESSRERSLTAGLKESFVSGQEQMSERTSSQHVQRMPDLRGVLSRLREDVEEEFRCIVCLETEKELQNLRECQHLVCTECVGRLQRSAKGKQGLICPLCRRYIEIPASGLPVHFLVENIRGKLPKKEQELAQDEPQSGASQLADAPPQPAAEYAKHTEELSVSAQKDLKQMQDSQEEELPGASGLDTRTRTEAPLPSLSKEHMDEKSAALKHENTKYSLCWKTRPLAGETSELKSPNWYRDMKSSRMTLDELLESVAGEEITHLVIKGDDGATQNSNILNCLQNMRNLESLCIVNVEIMMSDEVRDVLVSLELRHLSLSKCGLETDSLASISKMTSLEELELTDNNLSDTHLTEMLSDLSLLKKLDLSSCKLNQIPPSVSKMTSLEELKMSENNLSSDGSLNDKMDTLTLLKKLDLSNCRLSEIPSSIYRMVSLEELDLQGNRLLHQTLNRDSLHIQTPLKKLNISDCRLTEIPPSIHLMVSLEELDMSHNKLSSDKFISEKLFSLSSVRRLILRSCKLPEIPRSISLMVSLEELDLSHNNLSSDKSISEKLSSLTSVRRLDLQCCHLTEIPESVRQLVCLRRIDLSENYLETLPWSVFGLPFIELIDLTGNGNLKCLGSSKFEMSKLQKLPQLVLEDCYQLRQPPLQICLQGTEAILNYYTAMGKDESGLLSLLTVGVLGESFSGKTSVVKSLKQGKRILTQRSKTSTKDETTVVFNQETVDIHGGKSDIRFINFGGNGVYHPAYKLALRSNFIPALVVDIKRYMDLSVLSGCAEATRRLCFDWLAHFYLTDHKLGRPLLVLTHKDKLSDNQEQQKKLTKIYRDRLLDTVARLQLDSNMMVFEDKAKSIFEDVFIVGNDDSFDEFHRLLQCIDNRTKDYLYEVPDAWKFMMKTIEDSEEPYLEIEYLKSVFTDSTSLFVMLRFMHRSGRILWLEDLSEEISTKIFHKIQEVTHTIAILFNHNGSEEWEKRKVEYLAERDEAIGGRVGDTEFPAMIYRYQRTGMIDERLLRNLIITESNLSVEVALSLMKSFLLIYGPIQEKDDIYYAVPYFSTTYTGNQWKYDGDIRLRLSLSLDSPYALPQHAYHQMSLLLVSLDCNQKSSLEVKRNGATIYHEGWKTHFIHDHNNSEATLQASTSVEKLTESWITLRTSVTAILDFLFREWEAVRPRFIVYCGSCLLTNQLKPDGRFFSLKTASAELAGGEMVYCEEEDCDVPACLVRPCYSMSADELESLRSYIHHLLYKSTADRTEDYVSLYTPAQPTQREETWETPQELDDLMKNTADANIILTPHQTPEFRQELYYNTDEVYPMSGGKRGRVLIISNKFSSCLPRGAEQDFINLKRMFESFHFDVIGEHKDYTAQEMHDTIVRETEDRRHYRYGMFALVISSHGNDGLVYGNDDHSIRLRDIYGLLSASKFPAMKGKPKLIVIEACSGGMRDAPAELAGNKTIAHTISKPPITVSTAHDQRQGGSRRKIDRQSSGQTSEAASDTSSSLQTEPNLSMDHLMIIKSSLTGFGSMRHPANGSWLIRALVIAFYKHGHWRDLEELCVIARNQVRLMSIAISERKGEARGQIPDLTCTFTNGRKVYLFPGFHG